MRLRITASRPAIVRFSHGGAVRATLEPGATAMRHIAIVEQLDGKAVDWMEKVSDEQYQA